MHKHKKLGLSLLLTGLMLSNTVTFAFAEEGGPGVVGRTNDGPKITLEGPSGSQPSSDNAASNPSQEQGSAAPVISAGTQADDPATSESASQPISDTPVHTAGGTDAQPSVSPAGPGDAASLQPVTPGTGQDTANGASGQETNPDGTAADGTATDGTAADGTAADGSVTDGTSADGTATDAAGEAAADLNNPLRVPDREPLLQTTVLRNDSMSWFGPFVNDQQAVAEGQPFSAVSTYLEHIYGNILYRTYNSTAGWSNWAMNGQQTSHAGTWVPVEAIQYRFDGPVADKYDIYYSAFLSDGTQTDWAKNGETAGTMNRGLYMTGFRLAFFVKGTAVSLDTNNRVAAAHADGPQVIDGVLRYIHGGDGSNYTGWGWIGNDRYYFVDSWPVTGWQYIDGLKYYFAEDGRMLTDVEPIIGAAGPFKIRINKQMNCLTVYAKDGDNGYIIPVKSFLTSVGDDTPLGTFQTPEKYRWRPMINNVYTQYATRVYKSFLMHSIIYDRPDPYTVWASTYNNLGIARSAGCIRLTSGDSKWIYDHCPIGTTVEIYNSPVAGPFDRPTIEREIPFEQTWDPTDPNLTEEGIAAETARIIAAHN